MALTRTPLVSLQDDEGVNVIQISNGLNNTLNNDGLRDFLIALSDAVASGDAPILITSATKKSFSMGYTANCKRLSDKMHIKEAYSLGTTIAKTMLTSRKAIISAIDGYALGFGLEIALCSDIILSTERSTFGMPEIAFGLPLLTGILPELPDRVSSRAYSLIKKGRLFSSTEAKEAGIITEFLEEFNFQKNAIAHAKKVESRLFKLIKSGNSGSNSRNVVDELFFKIYEPTCLTMSQLERFRNSL